MKKLNFLISSALVCFTFSLPQKTFGTEDTSKHLDQPSSTQSVPSHTPQVKNNSLADFLQDSPLYHQVATEHYRSSVRNLRQEIINLQQNVVSAGVDSESSIVQKEIDQLTETLSLQEKGLKEYGPDQKAAQEKIAGEIEDLKESKRINLQNIIDKSHMKGLYEAQIKDTEARLEICKIYLAALSKNETMLKRELETAKAYFKTLAQKASSAEYIKETISQKREELEALYENHVKGLCSPDIFTHHLPKVVLECLGVSSAQLNYVQTERLFQLFARTLELPYVFVQTGAEKERVYRDQLKAIKQNLNNRLQEDIFCLQLSISMAQNKTLSIDLKAQNALVGKLLTNPDALKGTVNRKRDLETLKEILSSYGGYGEKNSSHFLETILNESAYGLPGLYIASLEFSPVSSWSHPEQISCHARLKDAQSPEMFSAHVLETVFGILGRHINRQVLENIEEKISKNPQKPTTPRAQDDFYV